MTKRTSPTATAPAVAPTAEKVSLVSEATAAVLAAVTLPDTTAEAVTAATYAAVRSLNTANRGKVVAAVVGSPIMATHAALAAVALPAVLAAPTGADPREAHAATLAAFLATAASVCDLAALAAFTLPDGLAEALAAVDRTAEGLAAADRLFTAREGGTRKSPARTLAELAAVAPVVTLTAGTATVTATVTADAVTIGKRSFASLSAACKAARENDRENNGWIEWHAADGRTAAEAVDAARRTAAD